MQEHRFMAGNRIMVEISDVAFGGKGVGRSEGMVVFVPWTVDGDVVEVEIDRVHRNYAEAELVKIITPSPFRVDPSCPYYGVCGGCHYRHITGGHELEIKEKQVRDAFERIGRIFSPPVRTIISSPRLSGYRQKADFHVRDGGPNGRAVGFMRTDGTTLVEIDRCDLLDESINAELAAVRANPACRDGMPERMAVWSNLPCGATEDITRRVGDLVMEVPARGFFQANAFLVETLAKQVAGACPESSEGALLDCCCGSGLFSLFAARKDRPVIGIDIDEEALRCARENLARLGVENVTLHRGTLEAVLGRLDPGPVAAAVVDPPRAGITKRAADRLASLEPATVVYVSCNPSTQARDVRRLIDLGYELVEVQPLDMFPRTKHVETVAVLARAGVRSEDGGTTEPRDGTGDEDQSGGIVS
ncbi:MAG TPA: class I SAM-dependent RNA methyltransferase [Deltaproteobacteria bacterium]|nr:class I SAM-dependent RNA methyltransferase [Deltaproteobacteria bacterium]